MSDIQDMLDKLNESIVSTLLDPTKEIFTRGKYKGKLLAHVARTDVEYLIWLIEESETDDVTIDYINGFLERNPEYLERRKEYE